MDARRVYVYIEIEKKSIDTPQKRERSIIENGQGHQPEGGAGVLIQGSSRRGFPRLPPGWISTLVEEIKVRFI